MMEKWNNGRLVQRFNRKWGKGEKWKSGSATNPHPALDTGSVTSNKLLVQRFSSARVNGFGEKTLPL